MGVNLSGFGKQLFKLRHSLLLGLNLVLLSQPIAAGASQEPPITFPEPEVMEGLAQQTSPIAMGSQVVINGQTVSLPWQQRAGRFGLADFGLVRDLGFEMLNSTNPASQPVRWFSDPTANPLVLSSWVEGGYRFLDITDITQRSGWQVQASGGRLQITTPIGQIQGIRRSRQDWGDRIVVDLTTPVTLAAREGSGEFTVYIDANGNQVTNGVEIAAQPGNLLTGLQILPDPRQTQIKGTMDAAAQLRLSTLTNPPRLVIDIRRDALTPLDIAWAVGVRWRQQYLTVNGKTVPVYWLEINPRQPGLSLRPIWPDPTTATGTAPLITTAQRWQVAAAINAGFFNRNNQYPLGAVRRDGQWISGPILGRGAIAWDDTGNFLVDRLILNQTLTTAQGQSFPLQTFNSGYVGAGIGLYTPPWGRTYTSILDNEVLITVVNNQVTAQQPTGAAGTTTVPLPPNGYILAVRANQAAVNALVPGTQLSLQARTQPPEFGNYPQIVAAGPLLVKQRAIVVDPMAESFSQGFASQAATRSAVGLTDQGKLLLVTVHFGLDGRGITLAEMAQLMVQLGSVNALNLDGGSSSALYLGGRLLNRNPSTAARVHNGIGVSLPGP